MARLILLLAAVALVWWWLRSRRSPVRTDSAAPKPPANSHAAHEMVSCAHCGVHLPQSDAVSDAAGAFYCSDEHRRLGPGPGEKP